MILTSQARSRQILVVVLGFFALCLILLGLERRKFTEPSSRIQSTTQARPQVHVPADHRTDNLHILLPASNEEVNLCKTLLTAAVLDYPTPTLIAWNQTFDNGGLLGGGSHVAKISGVLEWLESQDPSANGDLVLMMDAYGAFNLFEKPSTQQAHLAADIWTQLPKETLISRYYDINAAANQRLSERLGKAFEAENLRQTIVFGAGKRCAPNQVHTVACYPMPESPLPDDVYLENTDTIMGVNKYTSLRQRWLNSGYIIGPVGDMRQLFRRAWEKVQKSQDHPEWDNGSNGAEFMYHGSDQSIFNIILGEQEFQREVMRRRHLTSDEMAQGLWKVKPSKIEGTIIDDPLNPSFTHEPMEHKDGKPDEFGIGLDYFSQLGQQTVNSEEDSRYLRHDEDIAEQLQDRHGHFDCPNRATNQLPNDILQTRPPMDGVSWSELPLYHNLCLDQIPVMIHHNGNKGLREVAWPMMWIQPHARKLMSGILDGSQAHRGGANTAEGQYISFNELCPKEMEQELFRDVKF